MEIESQCINLKAFNDWVLRIELKCSVDSVDLIPQIPRERFKFVLFLRIGGSNFSCSSMFAIVTQKIKYFLSDTCTIYDSSWDKKIGMRISPKQFFPNVQRTEDESTYRKVKSTDQYVVSFTSTFRCFDRECNETAKRICLRLSRRINPMRRAERKQQRTSRARQLRSTQEFFPVWSNKRALRFIYLVIYLTQT